MLEVAGPAEWRSLPAPIRRHFLIELNTFNTKLETNRPISRASPMVCRLQSETIAQTAWRHKLLITHVILNLSAMTNTLHRKHILRVRFCLIKTRYKYKSHRIVFCYDLNIMDGSIANVVDTAWSNCKLRCREYKVSMHWPSGESKPF